MPAEKKRKSLIRSTCDTDLIPGVTNLKARTCFTSCSPEVLEVYWTAERVPTLVQSQAHTLRRPQTAMKAVSRVMPASRPHWVGNGFHVYPVFAQLAFTKELSPWLMFDYAAPKQFGPTSERKGVGQHPHRGFETVTIAFQGAVEHTDSTGNNDVIQPGDVQWMTAGRGIIHEEYHSTEFARSGGTFEMCQLWVNLPKKHKMVPPRYQPVVSADIPTVPLKVAAGAEECAEAGSVRVIAGELDGTRGPAQTYSPIELWDIQLPTQGAPVELEVPSGHNMIVFVRRGGVLVGAAGREQKVGAQGVALMEREGTTLRLSATQADTQLLLLGGEPIDEPIAARGPFVMNTEQEIMQANRDFQSGKMGR